MECQSIAADQPLRQGDILKQFGVDDALEYRVVISADCDLAQGKGQEHGVACLEILRLSNHLTGPYAVQLLRRHHSRALRELNQWIQATWRQRNPERELDGAAIDRWIAVAPVEEIEQTLGLEPQPNEGILKRLTGALRRTKQCLDNPSFREVLACMSSLQSNPPENMAALVRSQLGKLDPRRLPDDLFFLSELPDESDRGFIVLLRRLLFIDVANIVGDVPTARERPEAYVRIGRLLPTFKHGLAQQFGSLYARVGYPQPYEDVRDLAFSSALDEISAAWTNEHE